MESSGTSIAMNAMIDESSSSEEDGVELEYISMPHEISCFEAPNLPDPESVRDLIGAKQTMDWLRDALNPKLR